MTCLLNPSLLKPRLTAIQSGTESTLKVQFAIRINNRLGKLPKNIVCQFKKISMVLSFTSLNYKFELQPELVTSVNLDAEHSILGFLWSLSKFFAKVWTINFADCFQIEPHCIEQKWLLLHLGAYNSKNYWFCCTIAFTDQKYVAFIIPYTP